MADEVAVKEHCHAYDNYLELTKEKKELIVKYKGAKEEERIGKLTKYDSKQQNYKRLNSDLDLHLGSGSARGASASGGMRSSAGMMSMEERISMKDQLREWKNKKNEEDNKERLDRITAEKKMQQKLKRKLEAEREAKRNMIEEYKFKKEMDKQREIDVDKLEKKKQQEKLQNLEQAQRIRAREQEMWTKKHMMIMQKEDAKYERAAKMEAAKGKLSEKYNKKVESRLHTETTAM